MKSILKTIGLTAILALSMPAWATVAQGEGQVRRIQAKQHKITIKQKEIKEFNLPAITLVYQIDPSLLQQIKEGDTILFKAEHKDNEYFILEIKPKIEEPK